MLSVVVYGGVCHQKIGWRSDQDLITLTNEVPHTSPVSRHAADITLINEVLHTSPVMLQIFNIIFRREQNKIS